MNEYKYHYLFTTFDIEAFDMEDFKYNFVNITAFRLVDVNDIGVKELLKEMERHYSDQNINVFNKSRIIEVRGEKIFQTNFFQINFFNAFLTLISRYHG